MGFRGTFLRNNTQGNPARHTALTLTGLPKHNSISIGFLLALIDTWDGTGGRKRVAAGGTPFSTHADDYFNVSVDGRVVFKETFFVLSDDSQTYLETKDTLLSRGVDRGFMSVPDLAYDMSHDSGFQNMPHTGDTVTISFFASGSGWQGLDDES